MWELPRAPEAQFIVAAIRTQSMRARVKNRRVSENILSDIPQLADQTDGMAGKAFLESFNPFIVEE